MTDAAGAAQGVRREAETMVRAQMERVLRDLDVATREEVDVLRDLVAALRAQNEALAARVAAWRRPAARRERGPGAPPRGLTRRRDSGPRGTRADVPPASRGPVCHAQEASVDRPPSRGAGPGFRFEPAESPGL